MAIEYISTEAINEWAIKVEAEMRNLLSSAGKVATGNLIKSIDIINEETDNGIKASVNVQFTDYGNYVLNGRKPGGKMPPLQSLIPWMSLKGIPSNMAFPIAKSIALKGIKPFDFTMPFFNDIPQLTDSLATALANEIAKDITNKINK